MPRKKKKDNLFLKITSIFFIIFLIIYTADIIFKDVEINLDLTDFLSERKDLNLIKKSTVYNLNESPNMGFNVFFCPVDDCYNAVIEYFSLANQTIKCALYDLNQMNFSKKLLEKSQSGINVSIVTDDEYLKREPLRKLLGTDIEIFSDIERGTRFNNYMHHKFCVIDEKYVLTGSANPTDNGVFRNDNDILIFESEYIAKNYLNEFAQMSAGYFGYNKKSYIDYANVTLLYNDMSIIISSYMCPQDRCDRVVSNLLEKAEKEILIASFVFTNDDFAEILIRKHEQNVEIYAIIESRSVNSRGTVYPMLSEIFEFKIDRNPGTMHHKFFVIDEKYVITGSMNPSLSGVRYNDENILVIYSEDIAMKYKNHFNYLFSRE